jgi:hypothetical protein
MFIVDGIYAVFRISNTRKLYVYNVYVNDSH